LQQARLVAQISPVFADGPRYAPFLRDRFRFATLHPDDLGICVAASGAGLACIVRRLKRPGQSSPHGAANA
jgi:hypothetical protein